MSVSCKPIVVCADDYGLAPGVSRGIRDLLAAARLNATSVMTVFPDWREEAAALRPHADNAAIGLHLTLTDHPSLGAMPRLAPRGRFPDRLSLMRRAQRGPLPLCEITGEIERQLDAFETALGRLPTHVDAHHHVHQLPGIAAVLVGVLRRRAPHAVVRTCWAPRNALVRSHSARRKATRLAELGRALRRRLVAAGLPTNADFRGVYDFSRDSDYGPVFTGFLPGLKAGAQIMCHPGYVDDVLRGRDSLAEQRERELEFLMSEAYLQALARFGLTLAKIQ